MAFPIQRAGDFIGVLEFFTAQRMEQEPNLLNMMTAIGSEIGQFFVWMFIFAFDSQQNTNYKDQYQYYSTQSDACAEVEPILNKQKLNNEWYKKLKIN